VLGLTQDRHERCPLRCTKSNPSVQAGINCGTLSHGEALDAGLIAAAQAVEHYEITRYGTLLAWAKQLGLTEAEGLIQETLIQEENTD
jgi:ferritin-like metal-binding protein YciE